MGDQGIERKWFVKDSAIVARRIIMTGATRRGEHVGLEIETEAGRSCVLLVPAVLVPRLLLSLMTAGGIAEQERLGRFGSYRNIVAAEGFSAFRPTGHDVARVKLIGGEDVVLLRLKQGSLPIIDVQSEIKNAHKLAADILAEIAGEMPTKKPSN